MAGIDWGIRTKRLSVDLQSDDRPGLIHKDSERFGEVVNMVATLERLIAAIGWFEQQLDFAKSWVAECHPSTSAVKGSNDLVLKTADRIVVRCEVCDVASSSAGQNGKERTDVASLGCADEMPCDGARRFLRTSSEFAIALQNVKRNRVGRHYRYRQFDTGDGSG